MIVGCGALFGLAATMAGTVHAQAPDLSRLDVVERSVPGGPVALVRGEPITRESYIGFYRAELTAYARQSQTTQISDSDRVKIGVRCLARLVQREVLRQEAQQRKLSVPDSEVDAQFNEEIQHLQRGFSQQEGRPVTLEEALKMADTTREAMRDAVRESLLVDKAYEAVAREQGIAVSDAEIAAFYKDNAELFDRPDSVHLRQIYVRPLPTAQAASEAQWEEANAKAQRALGRVRAGEKFETVARDMSDAPDAQRGGDMGLVPSERLPEAYRAAITKMKPGDMSEVLRSPYGLHIVQLMENQGGSRVSLEEARPRIRASLERDKAEMAVLAWSEPILDDPEQVRVFLALEKTLAALGVNPQGQG
jgi:parvulin-like peptidyl-prolyl isomerase